MQNYQAEQLTLMTSPEVTIENLKEDWLSDNLGIGQIEFYPLVNCSSTLCSTIA